MVIIFLGMDYDWGQGWVDVKASSVGFFCFVFSVVFFRIGMLGVLAKEGRGARGG